MTNRPTVMLTPRDRDLLLALREHASLGLAHPEIVGLIERKLAVTEVLAEGQSRPHHIQIGSALICRAKPCDLLVSKLVLSPRLVFYLGDIVVTTPLGMALLGMPAGSVVTVAELALTVWVDNVAPPNPVSAEMATSACSLARQDAKPTYPHERMSF